MKKIILVLVAGICWFQLWSQGTVELTAGANGVTTGQAYWVLENMHLKNNGTILQTAGNGIVKMTGGLNVNLSGSSATTFDTLKMAKSANALNLQSNISVISEINFTGGLINLNNNFINLGTTGFLTGESENSRAFTIGTGYIQASGVLNHPTSADLGKLGAVITSTTNLGHTIIRRGHKIQTAVSGANNSIRRYFDIIPAINMALKATLRLKYFDAELNGITENTLNHWMSPNLVNWNLMGADSRDIVQNYVERKTYGKFDRITLATASAPSISCPGNQTVSANLKGCKAQVSFAASANGIPMPSVTYRIGNSVITSPFVFSKGTTTVTATASNGVSPDATCSFSITVECGGGNQLIADNPSVKEEMSETLSMTVMPNPSHHYFSLHIKGSNNKPVNVRIVDASGRILSAWSDISSNSTLNVGHTYRPGMYIVEATQGKQKVLLKLIKHAP